MAKGKILYVNQEVMPFTPESENAIFGRYLPAFTQDLGREIRVFMPRFNIVSERKNQLHEVIRLSGMNLVINDADHPLVIKVASIQPVRIQVYFIDLMNIRKSNTNSGENLKHEYLKQNMPLKTSTPKRLQNT